MIIAIDHLVLCVADVERSVAWYGEHLGLEAERLDAWRAGEVSFVSLRVNDATLVDLMASPPDGRNVDHVAFVTDRAGFDAFAASHASVIELGPTQLFGAKGVGDGVYVRDPDGHRVEVRTYDRLLVSRRAGGARSDAAARAAEVRVRCRNARNRQFLVRRTHVCGCLHP